MYYDFNEEWIRQSKALARGEKNYYDDNKRSRAYDASNTIRIDGIKRAQAFNIEPNWTALDIGPGPGTLTIPLAHRVKHVTAVEPSKAMIKCLLEHKNKEKLDNIDIINKRWEDADINELDRYDIVIASYSLNMVDIKDALLKMNKVALKKVHLYWFAGIPSWEQINLDLYPLIKKENFKPLPKCDILYNVLYDMGIYPDVTVLSDTCFSREFNDLESAIDDLKKRLDITSDSYNNILTDYINKHYVYKENKLTFVDKTKYVRISWTPVML